MAENQDLITPELINRIASGQTTLDDLEALKQRFAVDSETLSRKEFVAVLGEKLSDDALHKFNSQVMKHSEDLAVPPDTKFMYRTTNMKFFQEMLVLEAKREGMRVELGPNGVTENTMLSSIPPKILELYAILNGTLHEKFKDDVNNKDKDVMAEVMSWVLTSSLARESEYYKKADQTEQQRIELEIINSEKDKTRKSLQNQNILDQVKKSTVVEPTIVKPAVETIQQTTSAILDSYNSTLKSLEIIKKSLDSLGSNIRTSPEGKTVTLALFESLKQVPHEDLENNEQAIIKFLSKTLKGNVKDSKLIVTDEDLQTIKEELVTKAQEEPKIKAWSLENANLLAEKIVSGIQGLSKEIPEPLKQALQPAFVTILLSIAAWYRKKRTITDTSTAPSLDIEACINDSLASLKEDVPDPVKKTILKNSSNFFTKTMENLSKTKDSQLDQKISQNDSREYVVVEKEVAQEAKKDELDDMLKKVVTEELNKLTVGSPPEKIKTTSPELEKKDIALGIVKDAIETIKKTYTLSTNEETSMREILSESLKNVNSKILEKNSGKIQEQIVAGLEKSKELDTILPRFMQGFADQKKIKVPEEALENLGAEIAGYCKKLEEAGKGAKGMSIQGVTMDPSKLKSTTSVGKSPADNNPAKQK